MGHFRAKYEVAGAESRARTVEMVHQDERSIDGPLRLTYVRSTVCAAGEPTLPLLALAARSVQRVPPSPHAHKAETEAEEANEGD